MPLPAPLEPNDWALIQACNDANVKDVERLLPICDVRKSNFAAFRGAVRKGDTGIVQLFLSASSELPIHAALHDSVLLGHTTIVPLLVGDRDSNNCALQTAAVCGSSRREIIELLLPCCDYQQTLKRMEHNNTHNMGHTDTTVLQQCIEEYENEMQRQRLTDRLELHSKMVGVRKI